MSSLRSISSWSFGLLSEQDYIRLHSDLSLQKGILYDSITKAQHRVHPLAEKVIQFLCQGEVPLSEWLSYCKSCDLTLDQVKSICFFLNDIGGLQIKRSKQTGLQLLLYCLQFRLIGGKPTLLTRRFPANLGGILQASLRYISFLLFLAPFSLALAYAIGLFPSPLISTSGESLFILWISIVAHEYAHMATLSYFSYSSCVLQKGFNLGILHPILPEQIGFLVALAGPLFGALICLIFSLFNSSLNLIYYSLAFLHLLSLLPFYGDGRAILTFLRSHVSSS